MADKIKIKKGVVIKNAPDAEKISLVLKQYRSDPEARIAWETDWEEFVNRQPSLEVGYPTYENGVMEETVCITADFVRRTLRNEIKDAGFFSETLSRAVYGSIERLSSLPADARNDKLLSRSIKSSLDALKLYDMLDESERAKYAYSILANYLIRKGQEAASIIYKREDDDISMFSDELLDRVLEDNHECFFGLPKDRYTTNRLYRFIASELNSKSCGVYNWENVPDNVWDRVSWIGSVQVDPKRISEIPKEYLSPRLLDYVLNKVEDEDIKYAFSINGVSNIGEIATDEQMARAVISSQWRLENLPEKFQTAEFYDMVASMGGGEFIEWVPNAKVITGDTINKALRNYNRHSSSMYKTPPHIWDNPDNAVLYASVVSGDPLKVIPKKLVTREVADAAISRYHYSLSIPEAVVDDELVHKMLVTDIRFADERLNKKYFTDDFFEKYIDEAGFCSIPEKLRTKELLMKAFERGSHVDFKYALPFMDREVFRGYVSQTTCHGGIPHVDQSYQTEDISGWLVEYLIEKDPTGDLLRRNLYMVAKPSVETLDKMCNVLSAYEVASRMLNMYMTSEVCERLVDMDSRCIACIPMSERIRLRTRLNNTPAAPEPVQDANHTPAVTAVAAPKIDWENSGMVASLLAGDYEQLSFDDFFKTA